MNRKGFTLIEMLIVVVVFLIIVGVSVPLYFKFQEISEKESITQEIIQAVREIQLKAQMGIGNNNHGLYFSGHTYTVYTGDSFSTKDPTSVENYEISDIISVNAPTDLNFLKNEGTPTGATILSLVNDRSGVIYTINISQIGLIK